MLFLRRLSPPQLRGLAAAMLASLIGAGFSAHAGLTSLSAASKKAAIAQPEGYEADDHFPGSLLFNVDEDGTTPGPGTTGTTALPDLPIPATALDATADGSVRPAPAFRLTGTATDKARALQCLTTAIYYEAATEPDNGQRAVAQVILNRARHPAFPASVCGVVYQGSEKRGCQFSFACDGSMARTPSREHWARAARVAASALAGGVFAPVGMATHYHTYAVTPSWNRSLVMTGVFGAHFFHRWMGYWGTPTAFTQRYVGHEPVPGPHARVDTVATPAPATPQQLAAASTAPPPVPGRLAATPKAAVQPAYADSGAVQPKYAESMLPESTILDKWKDTGRPLR